MQKLWSNIKPIVLFLILLPIVAYSTAELAFAFLSDAVEYNDLLGSATLSFFIVYFYFMVTKPEKNRTLKFVKAILGYFVLFILFC